MISEFLLKFNALDSPALKRFSVVGDLGGNLEITFSNMDELGPYKVSIIMPELITR